LAHCRVARTERRNPVKFRGRINGKIARVELHVIEHRNHGNETRRKSQPTSFAGANENSLAEYTLFGVAKYDPVAAASIIASRRNGGRSMKTVPRMIARKKMFRNPSMSILRAAVSCSRPARGENYVDRRDKISKAD
jgi:hypothetical protein